MNKYSKIATVNHLQDLCALFGAERNVNLKLTRLQLGLFFGFLVRLVGWSGFVWLAVFAYDLIDSMNFYLQWQYGTTGLQYWLMEFDQVSTDVIGMGVCALIFAGMLIYGYNKKRNKVPCEELQKELGQISELKNLCFAENVVPVQYRTDRAVFYLYNWFTAHTSEDLDIALNTFVHESSEKLDTLVSRQSDALLLQRIQEAKARLTGTGTGAASLNDRLDSYFAGFRH